MSEPRDAFVPTVAGPVDPESLGMTVENPRRWLTVDGDAVGRGQDAAASLVRTA